MRRACDLHLPARLGVHCDLLTDGVAMSASVTITAAVAGPTAALRALGLLIPAHWQMR